MGSIDGLSEHLTGYETRSKSERSRVGLVLFRVRVLLLSRIVTAARTDGEFAVLLRFRVHADGAISAGALGRGRLVADRVLIADIVRGTVRLISSTSCEFFGRKAMPPVRSAMVWRARRARRSFSSPRMPMA